MTTDPPSSFRAIDNLNKLMASAIIRQYLPLIFGEDARIGENECIGSTGLRPDFTILLRDDRCAIVEVQTQSPNTQPRLAAAAGQLRRYRRAFEHEYTRVNVQTVLIIFGTLSTEHLDYLRAEGVDKVIRQDDLLYIARENVGPSLSQADRLSGDLAESEAPGRLLEELRNTIPGRLDWPKYEKLAQRTLELLFCPPLSRPISELAKQAGPNRRDFIFPNYATEGFWVFLRTHYLAHFVVVDAKNLTTRVKKTEVLQLANYLSDHGAGLFGMIVARTGGDHSADVTQREQWSLHRKMIIVVDDFDLRQMLALHSAGYDPSDLIRQKIEDFRLSF